VGVRSCVVLYDKCHDNIGKETVARLARVSGRHAERLHDQHAGLPWYAKLCSARSVGPGSKNGRGQSHQEAYRMYDLPGTI
jgi:hypothetical protein